MNWELSGQTLSNLNLSHWNNAVALALSILAHRTLSKLSLFLCFIFLPSLWWMHITERLAQEDAQLWGCSLTVSCSLCLEITFLGHSHERHWIISAHTGLLPHSTLGRSEIILLFSFPLPIRVLEMCCALCRKIRRLPLHTQGSQDYQTRLTCETVARRKVVLRGRETEGSGCTRQVTTVEMPVHRVSILLTFPPPAECLMLSLEPQRDWISLKSIFLFKILT